MKAYIFPGQGSQSEGMGADLYQNSSDAKQIFDQANDILGFNITETMFTGSAEELKQTKITQPAIFIMSVALAKTADNFQPQMVAGHSLGEFSALVANQTLAFEDALKLVYKRAMAMQQACEDNPSTMAAVLGLADNIVEEVCASIDEVVVAANYNCPGQLVISGSHAGIDAAMLKLKEAGAKRVMPIPVGGAFHSPLMNSAQEELATAINSTNFSAPICPIYQNATASPSTSIDEIKTNLIKQLTAPVRWTQSVQTMIDDGASEFIECGPGKVLQGLVKKIDRSMQLSSVQ